MTQRTFKIRFNTDYPHASKFKWRAIEVVANVFQQEILTNHISINCTCKTSTDKLPSGEIKHHITVNPNQVFMTDFDGVGYGTISFL